MNRPPFRFLCSIFLFSSIIGLSHTSYGITATLCSKAFHLRQLIGKISKAGQKITQKIRTKRSRDAREILEKLSSILPRSLSRDEEVAFEYFWKNDPDFRTLFQQGLMYESFTPLLLSRLFNYINLIYHVKNDKAGIDKFFSQTTFDEDFTFF